MTIVTIKYLYCDGDSPNCVCSESNALTESPLPNRTDAETRDNAMRVFKWTFMGGKDYCPACYAAMRQGVRDILAGRKTRKV